MSKKILVCDDDEAIAEVLQIMLEEAGYRVKLLFNGKAIQKRIKEYMPDLILLDIWMPGIGGEEVTHLLKTDPTMKHIPIVIISALHEHEVRKIVKKIGASGFLAKPFEMRELLDLVKLQLAS